MYSQTYSSCAPHRNRAIANVIIVAHVTHVTENDIYWAFHGNVIGISILKLELQQLVILKQYQMLEYLFLMKYVMKTFK